MRVLFCKIHCPLICFCKPSVADLYSSEPQKLENSRPKFAVSDSWEDKSCGEGKEESVNGNKGAKFVGKSCIKKLSDIVPESTEKIVKKKVQWNDNLGKELAQIKEFESSETGDMDNEEENSRCLCAFSDTAV